MDNVTVNIELNGDFVTAEVPPRMLLVQFLRERMALTGAHVGCDTSQCGACTVHLDGVAIKSCTMLAVQANNRSVTTIEGLDPDANHPLQLRFQECHALQCGYCTPGMIMAAADLIHRDPEADEEQIRKALEGNLCRCTGYQPIIKAVQCAAGDLAALNAEIE